MSQLNFILCIRQVLISLSKANNPTVTSKLAILTLSSVVGGCRKGSLGGRTKIHLMTSVWYNCMLNESEATVWD